MSASKWKPYPEYKKSNGPTGMLPISWSEVRFRMLFDTQKGKIPSEIHTEALPDSVPYLTLEYIRKGKNPQYVVLAENLLVLYENDILIWWDGTAGEILKSPLGVISSTAAHISPKYDECRDFDYYSLKAMEPIIKSGNTGMGIPHVDGVFLKELYLPRPELDEKEKIAHFLVRRTEIIDSGITRLKQKLSILEEKRSALITQVVTKGLNKSVPMKDSGIEWVGEFPEHWRKIKLGHLSTRIGDGLHGTPKYVDNSDYRFINGNNLVNSQILFRDSTKFVSFEEYQKHHNKLDDSSLVLSINGTIGVSAFYNDEKVILGKSAAYVNCKNSLYREFLHQYLQSTFMQDWMLMEAGGTTIPNLSLESIRNMPILCPPIEEQREIFQHLEKFQGNFQAIKSGLMSKIEILREYRTALISAAVTGKIDVRESV